MKILDFCYDEVPENVKVTQIYGVPFTENGKILIRKEIHKGKDFYSLGGGTPEQKDKDLNETLKREMLEEVNVTLKGDIFYIGYQPIDEENGEPVYAQVRSTALISEIGEKSPDPDNGKIYDRFLVSSKKAIELLNWGDNGAKIINKATEIIEKEFNIKIYQGEEIEEV